MIATILAAGTGSRLMPLTATQPKCLLKVGQRSLLGRAFDALYGAGIEEFVVVTGYCDEMIRSFLKSNYPNLNIHFVKNPDYDSTNNTYSLWLAKSYLAGREFVLLDSDVLFDPGLIRRLIEEDDTVLAMNSRETGAERMKVATGTDGTIAEISTICDLSEAAGEAVGIEKVCADFSKALFKELEQMVGDEHLAGTAYTVAFERLIHKGYKMRAIDTTDLFSAELDTMEDLRRAKEMIPEEMF